MKYRMGSLLRVVLTKTKMNATTENVTRYEALRIVEKSLARCKHEGRKTMCREVLHIFIMSSNNMILWVNVIGNDAQAIDK